MFFSFCSCLPHKLSIESKWVKHFIVMLNGGWIFDSFYEKSSSSKERIPNQKREREIINLYKWKEAAILFSDLNVCNDLYIEVRVSMIYVVPFHATRILW